MDCGLMMKELFMEEYEKLLNEAEEAGLPADEISFGEKAMARSRDRFADMCDEAKDRAKYSKK